MYKRILTTLDGSTLAEAALEPTRDLAKSTGAAVDLLLVDEPPRTGRRHEVERTRVVPTPVEFGAATQTEVVEEETPDQMMQRIAVDHERYLNDCATLLNPDVETVTTTVKFADDVVETIVDHARETDAAAIVMATHGRTGLSEAVFGSVASAVVRKSPVPVMLMRPNES